MRWITATMVTGVIATAAWFTLSERTPSGPHRLSRLLRPEAPALEGNRDAEPRSGSTRATSEEVRRLREELRQKDRLLGVMAVNAALNGSPDTPEEVQEREDSIAETTNTLDQRMFDAPPDAVLSARLEGEVETLLSALPESVTTDLACASTMCRVVLSGENAELGSAVESVSEQLPKTFATSLAFETDPGEKTLYLAREGETLQIAPVDAHPESTAQATEAGPGSSPNELAKPPEEVAAAESR